ncbi:hypothetical protein H0H87_007909 [Tephrocybe sp. NHM501043]|nr:hypothetical protein H0H87_007909 [Tephrocybe sp. NHM501043]
MKITKRSSPERPNASPPRRRSRFSPDQRYSPSNFEQDDDDVFLHFDPEFDQPPSNIPSTLQSKGNSTLVKTPRSKIVRNSPPRTTSISKTKTTPSKRFKSPTKGKKQNDETIESLEARMKEKIIRHSNLHLRILRYEPIHFDIFLRLMLGDIQELASATEKQKTQLRSVLDKLAIHFYGADASWTKRRRR